MGGRTIGNIRLDKNSGCEYNQIHYYDSKFANRVKCDASHSGLGASLEQQKAEGEWVPIAFASR